MPPIVPWQREPGAPRRRWWSRVLRFVLGGGGHPPGGVS